MKMCDHIKQNLLYTTGSQNQQHADKCAAHIRTSPNVANANGRRKCAQGCGEGARREGGGEAAEEKDDTKRSEVVGRERVQADVDSGIFAAQVAQCKVLLDVPVAMVDECEYLTK